MEPEPSEQSLVERLERLWLAVEALSGFVWLATGITAATTFFFSGYSLAKIGYSSKFVVLCSVLTVFFCVIAWVAFMHLVIALALFFRQFRLARRFLGIVSWPLRIIPIRMFSISAQLTLAYCYQEEGDIENASTIYGSLTRFKNQIRRLSIFVWGDALDKFAEWLAEHGQLEDEEKWQKYWTLATHLRRSTTVFFLIIPFVLFQQLIVMLPGIAQSLSLRGDYQAASGVMRLLLATERVVQPQEKFDSFKVDLAENLVSLGDYAGADALYRQVIADQRQAHESTADILENVRRRAVLMARAGQTEEAENIYKVAMSGRDQPDPLEMLLFAQFYVEQKQFDKAEKLLHDAIKTAVVPEQRAELLATLANAHRLKGDCRTAEQELNQAIQLGGAASESRLPYYKLLLVQAINCQGRKEEALKLLTSMSASYQRAMFRAGRSNYSLSYAFANTYREIGEPSEAERYYEELILSLSRSMGLQNPELCGYLVELSEVKSMLGKEGEARGNLERALSIIKEHNIRIDQPSAMRCLLDLGASNLRSQRFAAADSYFKSAMVVLQKTGVQGVPPPVLKDLELYAKALSKQGRDGEAQQINQLLQKRV